MIVVDPGERQSERDHYSSCGGIWHVRRHHHPHSDPLRLLELRWPVCAAYTLTLPSPDRRGLGRALLRGALLRTALAADIAGIRALVVHAKDQQARRWFGQCDFDPSPSDPLHLFLVMKDLKRLIER